MHTHTHTSTAPWTVQLSRCCWSLTVAGEGYTCIWRYTSCFTQTARPSLNVANGATERWEPGCGFRLSADSHHFSRKVNLLQHFIKQPLTLCWPVSSPSSRPKCHILWCSSYLFHHRVGLSLMSDCVLGHVCYCGIYCSANLIHCAMMHKGHNIQYFPSQTAITESLKWMLNAF